MPVCSYLVIPEPGSTLSVLEQLRALPGCEATPAENREVIVLVTDTDDTEAEVTLARQIQAIDGILSTVLTFGDLDGEAPVRIADRRGRGGAA
jgi:nitrate reductase NapAB chaperone NapD